MLVDFGGPENAPSPTCCMEARAISACFSASSCFISACFEGQVPLFGLSFLAEGHHPIWDLNDTVYKALSRQNMSKLLSTLYETNQWLPPQPCFPEKHCYFDKVLFDVVKTQYEYTLVGKSSGMCSNSKLEFHQSNSPKGFVFLSSHDNKPQKEQKVSRH